MEQKLPSLSIAIVTLNNAKTLPLCLEAIVNQDYPKDLIEYILVDGGSTDASREIAADFGFKVITSPYPRNAEAQRSVALAESKNELWVSIDADNIPPTNQWLRQMVKPFQENSQVVHANTLRYTWRPSDSKFNRYCALLGGADPLVYYLGIPDRSSWQKDKWQTAPGVIDQEGYYLIRFTPETLPTVGCNGIVARREVLLKAKVDYKNFGHTDIFMDLVNLGYDTFAIVKNDIIHLTAFTLGNLIKKRVAFLRYSLGFGLEIPRRYLIYNPRRFKDNIKLLLFIIYTLTIIKPLVDALRGYLKVRDKAWFLHPLVCWMFLYAYSKAFIMQKLKS